MLEIGIAPGSADELHPHLLYRSVGSQAEFATWRLAGGQEALAIFTTTDAAQKYQAEAAAADYALLQPPRDKLVAIFQTCLDAGIRVAALDPIGGSARTLFDIAQVLQAARHQPEK
jgi:hypothetical protein